MPFLTAFQSYQDDGSVKKKAVCSRPPFTIEKESNSDPLLYKNLNEMGDADNAPKYFISL